MGIKRISYEGFVKKEVITMNRKASRIIVLVVVLFAFIDMTGCERITISNVVPAVSIPLATVIHKLNLGNDPWYPYSGHTEDFYYNLYVNNGITVVTWNDSRHFTNWSAIIEEMVGQLHDRNIDVIGSISSILNYVYDQDEPSDLSHTRLKDPWGNDVFSCDDNGNCRYYHSMLHEEWQEIILQDIKTLIDAGVDGILIDGLAYGSLRFPDFNLNTVGLFRDYLAQRYNNDDNKLKQIINDKIVDNERNGCQQKCISEYQGPGIENFNYAQLVKDFLCDRNALTKNDWGDWQVTRCIPLYDDFQRFLRLKHWEVANSLIEQAKDYAMDEYSKIITVSANLNTLHSPEAPLVIDLLDYVDMEWYFFKYGYFPAARASTSLKLAQAFNKGGWVMTSVDTRNDLNGWDGGICDLDKSLIGFRNTVTLYKIMIADAHAAGGTFLLEEGMHCILQDLEGLRPYYLFFSKHPEAFDRLIPLPPKIGVLLLFESLMRGNPHDAPEYRGLCSMLVDSGYQFNVIFAAEDYLSWGQESIYPAPTNHPLELETLKKYPVIIIPELTDLTDNHADRLLQYVNGGGKLLISSTLAQIDQIKNHAKWGDKDPDGNSIERQNVTELIGYLNNMGGNTPISITDGILYWSDKLLGRDYLLNVGSDSRRPIKNILSDFEKKQGDRRKSDPMDY
jgi:hypothetical protein